MNARRVLAQFAFVLLLLSQQLGITHAISHLSSAAASGKVQDKQLPAELQCEQCLAFAAIGAGLVGSPPQVPLLAAPAETGIAIPLVAQLPPVPRAFDSRAPPIHA
ncbi:MAG TPA: hypothetical protein VJ698_18120 [Noviherbaspirillum sp.]|uniref:hypothetical protein n=1 Tax=Noviherbaspirillum sp. TaxID=1926288 RepID=UPI002B45FC31|nr:hypothetical protein [Noviherbaspirillum sp.]HJV87390.1 hypothetical protein [Noviherbaspirillum sp.]